MNSSRQGRSGRSQNILAAFARVLAHRVRTPLSVISNDLAYFATLLPQGETDRAASRCQEIAEILKESCAGGDGASAYGALDLGRLVKELVAAGSFAAEVSRAEIQEPAIEVQTDGSSLRQALLWLARLLKFHGGDSAPLAEMALVKGENAATLLVTARVISVPEQSRGSEFATFTDCFNGSLNADSLLPPMLDVSLWACGFEAAISIKSEFSIQLSYVGCPQNLCPACR